jgi:prepilin-type N-terminal cleavage/methylation domain-containing protein
MRKSASGFTIVELLIVIVVIGILAAITIVAYTTVQQKARDAQRKQDVTTIAKALKLYEPDNGPMGAGSGCGAGGGGNGYFNYNYASPGDNMNECLKTAGVINNTIADPQNTSTCSTPSVACRKYMKYSCSQSGALNTYVFANLETVGHTSTDTDGTCAPSIDTDYGMNYYVKITS